jgi:AraC-like DNA-binding protein
MDFHHIENVTIEDVKTAHIADLKVQDKYKVKYHQFWVNEVAGTVFCLIEGPDKESCEAVHQQAHGNIACALTEVERGFYGEIMGETKTTEDGLVINEDGTVDLAYRNILFASVYGITTATNLEDLSQLRTPQRARQLISKKLTEHKGRKLKSNTDDSLIGVFNNPFDAVKCAIDIKDSLAEPHTRDPKIILKLGLSAAQPVTPKGDFFKDALKLAHRLSIIAPGNQILISSLLAQLCKEDVFFQKASLIKRLTLIEENFVLKLIGIAEEKMSDCNFSMDSLSNDVCVSRPQLYRKITALTGKSPNDFIRTLRMDKAVNLLKQKSANISEIAYEVGFTTPSYFTKCFQEQFGCTPSAFAKANYV